MKQRLTQAQESQMIKDIQRVIPINDLQAREILNSQSWNLQKGSNVALDYQNRGQITEQQFNQYLAKGESKMTAEGIKSFCNDLGIDFMDPVILMISYMFKAETMGEYTKFDFLYGFSQLKCQTTMELRAKIPRLREEMQKKDTLKAVYKFCFDFSKNKNQIEFVVAESLWTTLLKPAFPIMNRFLEFVASIPQAKQTPISRDTYFMLFEFCDQIGTDLSKYDYLTGAWPIFIDEFYFYCNPHHRKPQLL